MPKPKVGDYVRVVREWPEGHDQEDEGNYDGVVGILVRADTRPHDNFRWLVYPLCFPPDADEILFDDLDGHAEWVNKIEVITEDEANAAIMRNALLGCFYRNKESYDADAFEGT